MRRQGRSGLLGIVLIVGVISCGGSSTCGDQLLTSGGGVDFGNGWRVTHPNDRVVPCFVGTCQDPALALGSGIQTAGPHEFVVRIFSPRGKLLKRESVEVTFTHVATTSCSPGRWLGGQVKLDPQGRIEYVPYGG
jgi:hypothetical protein